jgi:DNA-directed RNA polymerase subunit RPC12/RpoP
MSDEAKCKCTNCSQPISFPEEGEGTTIVCPHCGLDTILFIPPPPPKPETPKNFISDKKPEIKITKRPSRGSTTALKALLFLNLAATIAGGAFVFLIWQKQQQPPVPMRWDVKEFEFTGYSHKDVFDEKIDWHATLTFSDMAGNNSLNIKQTGEESAFSADYILDRLGNDGWELAWSDGTRYIVKRPQGKWLHEFFDVSYKEETNSVTR